MSCTRRAQALGRRVRQFLQTDAAYRILDDEVGGTWSAGGCWVLAKALTALIDAPLVAVWNEIDGSTVQHHVVVQLSENCYLDADGTQSGETLLRKMARVELIRDPYLAEFDPVVARRGQIACPTGTVQRLTRALRTVVSDA